jgi:biofilm PGA synthesis N-glycosyltransferase PgaC
MILIFSITAFIVLLYVLYPLWLMSVPPRKPMDETGAEEITGVSVILLSCNGKEYLDEKINFLNRELSGFENHELIIVDDNSNDGSAEVLGAFSSMPHVRILQNCRHEGIPFSMNLGVANAKYEYLIFCDQRQKLSDNILQRIVGPLKNKNVGAVSACISPVDNENRHSLIRRHENFLKSLEGRTGSLMGVYGPLYALKKQSYTNIPGYVILDDLWLSLRILKTQQIVFQEDCQIIDESISALYDYRRARKYLTGFLQILGEKQILCDLNAKQKIMLIWHKYLRLLIPVFLFLSYTCVGYMAFQDNRFLILFCLISAGGLISFLPFRLNSRFRPKNLVRLNIYYFFSMADVFINKVIMRRPDVAGEVARATKSET